MNRRLVDSTDQRSGVASGMTWRKSKEVLVQRLRDFLIQTQAERAAIEGEVAAVLAAGQGSETEQ
jgi:hypothetical protein